MKIHKMIGVGLIVTGLLSAPSMAADSNENELLNIQTRYGAVRFVENCAGSDGPCNNAFVINGARRIKVSSPAESLTFDKLGVYQIKEGDVVVVSYPSGERGVPDNYLAVLVSAEKVSIISDDRFGTSDFTYGAEVINGTITFDLGYENKKQKVATYSNGKLITTLRDVPSDPAHTLKVTSKLCEGIMEVLAECVSVETCKVDDFPPAIFRPIGILSNNPSFKEEAFNQQCLEMCKTHKADAGSIQQAVCGYRDQDVSKFQTAFDNNMPVETVDDGLAAANRKDYATALRIWQKLAEQGDQFAQNNMGWLYQNGFGVAQSIPVAISWYSKSAAQGNELAKKNLDIVRNGSADIDINTGWAAYQKGDYPTALRLFKQWADKGNALAQNNLGLMYQNGQGVSQNREEAVRLYKLSAAQGNSYAQANLQNLTNQQMPGAVNNNNVNSNSNADEECLDFRSREFMTNYIRVFNLAMKEGDAVAQNCIGLMAQQGHGTRQSYENALLMFKKSAAQGNRNAQNNLGILYENGFGTQVDLSEAAKWYKLAADQGLVAARNNLKALAAKQIVQNKPPSNLSNYNEDNQIGGVKGYKIFKFGMTMEQILSITGQVSEQEYLQNKTGCTNSHASSALLCHIDGVLITLHSEQFREGEGHYDLGGGWSPGRNDRLGSIEVSLGTFTNELLRSTVSTLTEKYGPHTGCTDAEWEDYTRGHSPFRCYFAKGQIIAWVYVNRGTYQRDYIELVYRSSQVVSHFTKASPIE